MTKREAALKSAFFREFAQYFPHYYVLKHSNRAAPDCAIHGAGHVTTWEFKHGTPTFETKGDQVLFCMRLAVANHCRFVIWQEKADGNQRTMIVHPRMVHEGNLVPDAACVGFDHRWLVEQVRKAHRA